MNERLSIGIAAIVGAFSCQFAALSQPSAQPAQAPTLLALAADGSTCEANDPKERPLNVRSRPGGRIVGRITNGMMVERPYRNRGQWERVRIQVNDRPVTGWVYRRYLICK